MPQGVLPFKYEEEKNSSGMTALAGLPAYLDLARAMRLDDAADRYNRRLALRSRSQGWTDGQIITALVMLNLAGGDCVDDLKTLEADQGWCRIVQACQTYGMTRKERRAMLRRWRKTRRRTTPSASSVFRYLNAFHRPEWDDKQVYGAAWVPRDLGPLAGFSRMNAEMLAFAQRNNPCKTATMDLDATLVETLKEDALCCDYREQKVLLSAPGNRHAAAGRASEDKREFTSREG